MLYLSEKCVTENVWLWYAASMALNCLMRTTVAPFVMDHYLFLLPRQGWSRSMPCPSRGTMSYVSTWKTLKIAPRTPSMAPLESASSLWTPMMMDTPWLWETIQAIQVCLLGEGVRSCTLLCPHKCLYLSPLNAAEMFLSKWQDAIFTVQKVCPLDKPHVDS